MNEPIATARSFDGTMILAVRHEAEKGLRLELVMDIRRNYLFDADIDDESRVVLRSEPVVLSYVASMYDFETCTLKNTCGQLSDDCSFVIRYHDIFPDLLVFAAFRDEKKIAEIALSLSALSGACADNVEDCDDEMYQERDRFDDHEPTENSDGVVLSALKFSTGKLELTPEGKAIMSVS